MTHFYESSWRKNIDYQKYLILLLIKILTLILDITNQVSTLFYLRQLYQHLAYSSFSYLQKKKKMA